MIYITKTELNIYNTYNSLKSAKHTASALHKGHTSIRWALRGFVSKGLMELHGKIYVPTGAPYKLITLKERLSGRLPKPKIEINISEFEKEWMLEHYQNRKRGAAAQTLDRTRADICLMAIVLEIDIESRWKHAKSNKGA